jgi:hypothetical protein
MEIKNVCCLLIFNVSDFEPPNFIQHIQVLLPDYNVTNKTSSEMLNSTYTHICFITGECKKSVATNT